MLDYCRVFVFQEIKLADQVLYQWFKVAEEDDLNYIVPSELLSADEHWERLTAD